MKQPVTVNRQTVGGMLPNIPEDFEQDMRGLIVRLPQERKEPVMKKKLSFGLVLALILALATLTALAAALLGGKDFTNSIVAPRALETASDKFTPAEIEEILKIAAENGVTLPDDLIARLQSSEEGYFKEELMRAFAKTELGFYPSCWSIEDQAWYARLLVACKLRDYQYAVVPEGDELTQEQALEVIVAAVRERLDPGFDPDAPGLYRRHMQYTAFKESEYKQGRRWIVEYDPLDLYHTGCCVQMLSDGTIEDVFAYSKGLTETSTVTEIINRFSQLYHDDYGAKFSWTEQNWLDCQALMAQSLKNDPDQEMDRHTAAFAGQGYLASANAAVPREQAMDLAKEAAREYAPFDYAYAIYLQGKNGPVWKVTLRSAGASVAYVEIDDKTGKVCLASPHAEGELACRPFVLEENMPAPVVLDPAANPTRQPNGMMAFWNNTDIAPRYFWDALNAFGYNSETGGDMYEKWCADYGNDGLFWPLDVKALEYALHSLMPHAQGAPVMYGLPGETDMTQDAALALAWDTFLASDNAKALGEEKARALKPSVCFFFNAPNPGDHTWHIAFVDVSENYGRSDYAVTINAATGEVIGTGLYTPEGNG